MLLAGRVALITGGGRGIGEGIATGFAAQGGRVAIAGRAADALAGTVRRLEAMGAEALAVPMDVVQPTQVEDGLSAVERCWGRLDILV